VGETLLVFILYTCSIFEMVSILDTPPEFPVENNPLAFCPEGAQDDRWPPFQFPDPSPVVGVQLLARLLISPICINEALPTSIVDVDVGIGAGAETGNVRVVDAS